MSARLGASLSLLALAFLALSGGAKQRGGAVISESDAPPSVGIAWMDSTTKDLLHYSTDYAKWIGPVFLWEFGNAGTNKTGWMKFAHTVCDTAAGNEIGAIAHGRVRIIGAALVSDGGDAPNCTTNVYADQTIILKLEWPAAPQDLDVTPTADSSGVWIAPAVRVIVADGEVVSTDIKAAASTPDNPDNPGIVLYCVREEDP